MDHAAFGVQLLFEEGKIRDFIQEPKWDSIIRTAIARHSDFKLDGISDERELLHSRLIRDADKLDNCRVKLNDSIITCWIIFLPVQRKPEEETIILTHKRRSSHERGTQTQPFVSE